MYMPKQLNHGLRTIEGETIALQSVNVEVAFNNLLCTTSMSQVYKNQEKNPIEAVYTFPLASRAVLLGLDVVIGGRTLQGVVVEKSSAEEQYEEAITDGNTAIMLEQIICRIVEEKRSGEWAGFWVEGWAGSMWTRDMEPSLAMNTVEMAPPAPASILTEAGVPDEPFPPGYQLRELGKNRCGI